MQTGEPFIYRLRDFEPEAVVVTLPPPVALPPEKPTGQYGGLGWYVLPNNPTPDAAPVPRRGGIAAALGLSQSHKCTHPFVAEVAEGGGRITIRQPSDARDLVKSGPEEDEEEPIDLVKALHGLTWEDEEEDTTRGRITEWSGASRGRLRRFIGGFRLNALDGAVMTTLTYPGEFPAPDKHDVYKGHLRAFKARVSRHFPLVSFVWKLEFQKRGAAHYHLIVFNLGSGDKALVEWKDFIDRAWFEVVGSGDEKHLRAGCNAERVKSRAGASAYLTKYLGKDDQTRPGDFTGRYWGVFNKPALPVAPVAKLPQTDREAVLIRRVMRKCTEAQVNLRFRQKAVNSLGLWAEAGATWEDVQAWHRNPGSDRFLPKVTPNWTGPSRALTVPGKPTEEDMFPPSTPFKMPPRYRMRNNATVTLYCDASAVWAKLKKWLAERVAASAPECPF